MRGQRWYINGRLLSTDEPIPSPPKPEAESGPQSDVTAVEDEDESDGLSPDVLADIETILDDDGDDHS